MRIIKRDKGKGKMKKTPHMPKTNMDIIMQTHMSGRLIFLCPTESHF